MIGKGAKRRGLMEISRRIVGKRTKVQISSISNTLFHEKFYVSVSYCVKTMKYESKLGIWLGEKRQKREGWWKYHGRSLEGELKCRSLRFRILCFTKNFMYASPCVKTMNRRSLEYKGKGRKGEKISRRIVGRRIKIQISSISNTLFPEKFYVCIPLR